MSFPGKLSVKLAALGAVFVTALGSVAAHADRSR